MPGHYSLQSLLDREKWTRKEGTIFFRNVVCIFGPSFDLGRYITLMTPEDPALAAGMAKEEDRGVDLRTLRAIRVLRPLKLVSGVPSE